MSRRKHEEFEAGSDSFLDVIANIVGILIILIVVVGTKMTTAPIKQAEIESAMGQVEAPAPVVPERAASPKVAEPEPPAAQPPLLVAPRIEQPREVVQPTPVTEPPVLRTPSPELEAEVDALRQTIADLEAKAAAAAELMARARSAQQQLEGQLTKADESVRSAAAAKESSEAEIDNLRLSVDDIASRLAAARRKLEALEKTKSPAEQIKHKVTPVSRTVKGEEIHFHLAKGKITPVPLDEMVERLRTQVIRQKEWLAKYRRHQGEIGPIGGFTMQYVVERQELSVVDELRDGTAQMRIGISQWQLIPEKDLPGETAQQAVRHGSAFQRALRQAKPDTVLTFWVYPDSFPLYRALVDFAHKEGYTVAARPLPEGLRISGSPNGSKSAGQ